MTFQLHVSQNKYIEDDFKKAIKIYIYIYTSDKLINRILIKQFVLDHLRI
jgi:hypothetical protein